MHSHTGVFELDCIIIMGSPLLDNSENYVNFELQRIDFPINATLQVTEAPHVGAKLQVKKVFFATPYVQRMICFIHILYCKTSV